ncbi:MAG: oxidative damage protection protein [Cycloclasticus sp. symbiont of Bathymodiolus heckerae]|nr:MAG: oxidative damage protection protein [Cycloclasticus sp. symbiont of Bathymodiolus heckerae]
MTNTVQCVVLKTEAEALDSVTHPGELGEKIFANVSKEGWSKWLERLSMIINENSLSTADVESIQVIEEHMKGFFFGEGSMGQVPSGFNAGAPAKGK